MTVGRSAASAARRAGSKSSSLLDTGAPGAARPGRSRRSPSARAPVATPWPRPAAVLPHPDRAVALVVEDDDDDPGVLADRGLELGHGHAPARRRRPAPRPGDRGGPGRPRSPPAGRSPWPRTSARGTCPGGGTGSPRPAQPREVAGVGGEDRLVREHPAQGRDGPARDGRPGRPTASSSTTVSASHVGPVRGRCWRRGPRRARHRGRPRPAGARSPPAGTRGRPTVIARSAAGRSPEPARHEIDMRPARRRAAGACSRSWSPRSAGSR